MILTPEHFEILNAVNKCQISELEKAGMTLDPVMDCAQFSGHVRNVQSAVIHTYQLTAFAAIREADPGNASKHWKSMVDFCDCALAVLRELRGKYLACGASDLYDLVLDYRAQAHDRYIQNLEDSECPTIPDGLFPKMS